jgi:hypothetical protein
MLSEPHLVILRNYWKGRQLKGDLLFPGSVLDHPITERSVQRAPTKRGPTTLPHVVAVA